MSRGVIKDISGQKFGRLLVLRATDKRMHGNVIWHCLCECGFCCDVKSGDLVSGRTKSCGCLRRDTTIRTKTKHGHAHTKISNVWVAMNQRCFNSSYKEFHNYGGRGIRVCDEWRDNFQAFYDYVSNLPHFGEKGYSLDRINNDGNYEPGNVRWATAREQCNNKRNSITLTHDGETKTFAEWAEITGISYSTIYHRVRRGKDPF